jgi:hypothetical protein
MENHHASLMGIHTLFRLGHGFNSFLYVYQAGYIFSNIPVFHAIPGNFTQIPSPRLAATGYPGAKHPYSWWRSPPRWMLRVFTVPWRAVNRILALSMVFSTRKMGGSHWEILTFGS